MTPKEIIEIAGGVTSPIVGIGGIVVALVTVLLSRRTSKDTLAVSRRQVQLEEAKVRSDLFDRRYAAWLEMRDVASARYRAILAAPEGADFEVYNPQDLRDRFRDAQDKLFFLFSNEVNEAARHLEQSFAKLYAARQAMLMAKGAAAIVATQTKFNEANMEADGKLRALRNLAKLNVQVGV
jgi:cystathionine beta-lyase/cystathionine gamma-synthase